MSNIKHNYCDDKALSDKAEAFNKRIAYLDYAVSVVSTQGHIWVVDSSGNNTITSVLLAEASEAGYEFEVFNCKHKHAQFAPVEEK